MIKLAKKNNAKASFAIMDTRKIDEIKTKYDGIVCGFCLPYLSHKDCKKLIAECYNLLNHNGLIYLSFMEGDPNESDFQTGISGDRVFFYFHNLDILKTQLAENKFDDFTIFKVNYKKSATEIDIHTILVARKN